MLSGAGLVAVRPQAQQRIYELREERFRELDSWLDTFAEVWRQRLDSLDDHLLTMKQREQR